MSIQKRQFIIQKIIYFMDCLEKRLKKARKTAGVTQPQLAELIGVSRRTVINYEKDASKAPVLTVQNIAIECGVNEIWLLTGQGKMEASTAATPEELTRHQNELKPSKDLERDRILDERLSTIKALNRRAYDRVGVYIHATYDAVMEDHSAKLSPSRNGSSG